MHWTFSTHAYEDIVAQEAHSQHGRPLLALPVRPPQPSNLTYSSEPFPIPQKFIHNALEIPRHVRLEVLPHPILDAGPPAVVNLLTSIVLTHAVSFPVNLDVQVPAEQIDIASRFHDEFGGARPAETVPPFLEGLVEEDFGGREASEFGRR